MDSDCIFRTFNDVTDYIEHFENLEKNPSGYNTRTYRTDRMSAILKHMGNPEKSFRAIHVAGSKGKGSVSTMLANAIGKTGYRCGLFTSPHLVDYRERFTLAGKFFEDGFLIKTAEELKSRIDGFLSTEKDSEDGNYGNPTSFELYTAFAYLLFKNSGCDYAVIETGLGGRLDATNTLSPVACVFTPVELEHTAILGDTIEKIAVEKSKIIRSNALCFISFQQPEAEKVFVKEAEDNGCDCYLLRNNVKSVNSVTTLNGEQAEIHWTDGNVSNLTLSLSGHVQADNAALAILTLKKLGLYRKNLTENALEETTLPGRFEKIYDSPSVYIDGAHTCSSLLNLLSSFSEITRIKNSTVIFGCLPDKDMKGLTDLIVKYFDRIIISTPGTYKKNNPEEIYKTVKSKTAGTGKTVVLLKNPSEALNYALKITPENSAVLATGSFYMAGAISEAMKTMKHG